MAISLWTWATTRTRRKKMLRRKDAERRREIVGLWLICQRWFSV